jgi:hypothetical protein
MGLYAAAGFGLLAIGVGTWFFLGRKSHQDLPTAANQTIAAASTAASTATQGGTLSTNPASTPLPRTAPVESTKISHGGVSAAPPTTAALVSQAKPEPTRTEAPKPAEDTPDQKLAKAASMIGSNPTQAASLLRGLAASQPGDLGVQGNLLAALYRSHNAGEFERVLDGAKARGLNCTAMMKAAPAFRQAMEDERGAHRAKNGSNVLPVSVLLKVVQ